MKVKLSNMYYNKFYIEYYNFYQQFKNYFATNETKKSNCIIFITFSYVAISIFIGNYISRNINQKALSLSIKKSLKKVSNKI